MNYEYTVEKPTSEEWAAYFKCEQYSFNEQVEVYLDSMGVRLCQEDFETMVLRLEKSVDHQDDDILLNDIYNEIGGAA